ncbi:MAG: LysR family transcriptional regulator [Alphaproteobacteria bacterium]|nr:LysR family transcriptional regulator [Alphaproteobacteria bacterium]MBU1560054.1 LysR family transcriptional regulator [Alphaproteobacteria bacterium]MBU2301231.1 LysR family transcriptional regulator [Alphaproteobacteria bacterium]MBU2366674.1 LysR family transcriptional regulator [Alphaproteobacteria bacterium]
MTELVELETFVATARLGSFAAAAQQLGVSATMVGRRIQMLEARYGGRLLERTTRVHKLTVFGTQFLEQSLRILEELAVLDELASPAKALQGILRISAPTTLGVATIGPAIAEFAKAHPALSVELSLSNRRVDLVSEGYDLAIRVGDLPSSALVSRRIGTCRLTCCAAPSWLATHHAPATPLDLANGGCIINSNFNPADVWRFMDAGGNAIVAKVAGNLQMDSDEAQRSVAKQGGGIAYLPLDLVRTDIADGSLVQLLKDFGTDSMPIHALYPSRRQLPKRVSGAIEAITTSLRAGEPAMYGMSASSDTSRHFE